MDESDRLFFEEVYHQLREDPAIQRSLEINEPEDVMRTFNQKMEDIMTGSVERKFQIVKKFLDNSEFKQDILGMFFAEILSNSQLDEAGKILNLIAQGESKTVEWKSRFATVSRRKKTRNPTSSMPL